MDFSEEMQAVARAKVNTRNVEFRLGDVKEEWSFGDLQPDLITCSLILEHVEHLGHVFDQAKNILSPGGHFYICELHPFKQYEGSKARFETEHGLKITDCFTHNVSDYTSASLASGFSMMRLDEWFDEDDRTRTPRLISFLFGR